MKKSAADKILYNNHFLRQVGMFLLIGGISIVITAISCMGNQLYDADAAVFAESFFAEEYAGQIFQTEYTEEQLWVYNSRSLRDSGSRRLMLRKQYKSYPPEFEILFQQDYIILLGENISFYSLQNFVYTSSGCKYTPFVRAGPCCKC